MHEAASRRCAAPGRARAACRRRSRRRARAPAAAGWITAAAWSTDAPPTPSNSASITAGSRTSPTTTSIRGSTTSSSAASADSCTRHRIRRRSGCAASARTRFWPEPTRRARHHNIRRRCGLGDGIVGRHGRARYLVARAVASAKCGCAGVLGCSAAAPALSREIAPPRLAFPCAPGRVRRRRARRATWSVSLPARRSGPQRPRARRSSRSSSRSRCAGCCARRDRPWKRASCSSSPSRS